ncbi:probable ATP-dependent DNA helicase HFM1 [Clupea harengus]|uniref:Probable ATP-dependent DNA helicase HFM1 n=1 Tax=Clupea harengus TaxID=7950 RepID=A0A8M1K9V9_CLUHA|nr:probable ATP-dependent DNA helicase HFM1 [Clupea harengus]
MLTGTSGPGRLRSVTEIPARFRCIFSQFPYFNHVQSKALDDILYTNRNLVASAPTGSGKTVLFELAIIRLLMESTEPWQNVKAVYMAPMKALCSQQYENWNEKFGRLGLNCKELTGDTEIDDIFEIQNSHLIMTTPEKWDSMTRRWKDSCLLQLIQLFLIDEVHVVKDTQRGATLEAVISRMKAMNTCRVFEDQRPNMNTRFVAVSATIPNISDIACWLSDSVGPATSLEMDESYRPVKLRKVVLGFPCSNGQNDFKFDLSLNYKMANIIRTYSDQKPSLVFCSTRKGVQQSADVLARDARFMMSIDHKERLRKYADSLMDSKLRDLVLYGVAYHHAGIDISDRKVIENAFAKGDLPVLFTTSTLAMGMNLPAHLVVIKSTAHYVGGACEEYSETDILQMIGRAGRPQFDTSATAVIMTKLQTKDKYTNILSGAETIESGLHLNLLEHLNAEIVLHTISDVNMALDWIRSTFLYIRTMKNPTYYGLSFELDKGGIEARLQDLCLKNLKALSDVGLITMDEDINIRPTETGKLMTRYCVAFDTIRHFTSMSGMETLSDLVTMVSKSKEFSDVQLRVNEKRILNTLNKDKNRTTIRFPMEGKIKNNEMKVNCLIQAQLGCIPVQEFGLSQDMSKIFKNGVRVSKCLAEFLSHLPQNNCSALLNALTLAKCFRAKLWEDSPYVSRQLDKIGLSLATAMVNAGLTTFKKIEQTNARELELIVNRHPPFGNQIRESILALPEYELRLEQLPVYSTSVGEISVTVNMNNFDQLNAKKMPLDHHYVTVIIGDCDNNVVFFQKLSNTAFLKSGTWSKKIYIARASKGEEISIHLISSEYVGLDIHQEFSAIFSAKPFGVEHCGPESMTTDSSALGTRGFSQEHRAQVTTHTTHFNCTDALHKDSSKLKTEKRRCNHFCKNKEQCGHDCCAPITIGQLSVQL